MRLGNVVGIRRKYEHEREAGDIGSSEREDRMIGREIDAKPE